MDRHPHSLARPLRVAVVGAGWAGLAAAVRLVQAGAQVSLLEMAPAPGGRARSVQTPDGWLDNGQHILIGAYARTLDLMRTVGVDPNTALLRQPLVLRYPDGRGLALPHGPAALAFARGVMQARGWTWRDRISLLATATGWMARGFRCPADLSVAQLCAGLPPAVMALLIEPLCVAALNTPARDASATVLLRVLRDALFGARGSADLLLPRLPLADLLPLPARRWLQDAGVAWQAPMRVTALERAPQGRWQVQGGEPVQAVVLACSAAEAARLAAAHAPAWAATAGALRYEPIVTVVLRAPGSRLPHPMMALQESADAPAQFVFDQGALGLGDGRFSFVISGAADWVARGLEPTARAVQAQALRAFAPGTWQQAPEVYRVVAERRATFRCTPALQRPPARICPGLWAAGDYVAGPYPATLEGAVRAGETAAARLLSEEDERGAMA